MENLFRKPVEYYSTAACGVGSIALLAFPDLMLMNTSSALLASTALNTYGLYKYRRGLSFSKFQAGLKRLPLYSLKPAEVPVNEKHLYLGMGFRWTQTHTQRLYDARLPIHKHLMALSARYDSVRAREIANPDAWSSNFTQKEFWGLEFGKVKIGIRNPVAPLPPVGGSPEIHGVGILDERLISTPRMELSGHTVVLGTTRVGKTRLAELLVTQDIRTDNVTIVIDPKGDVKLLQRMYAEAKRAGREYNFWVFHLGYPAISDRYSPIGVFGKITEVATRIANALPSEGQSAAFKDFVWGFVNTIARTGEALGDKPSYKWLYTQATNIDGLALRYFTQYLNEKNAGWKGDFDNLYKKLEEAAKMMITKAGRNRDVALMSAYIEFKNWGNPITEGLTGVLTSEKSYFQKLVSSLYPLLEKLTTGEVGKLLSPDPEDLHDKRRIFDWDKIISTGGIVYVGLDALSDYEVAGCVGNAMFADLTSLAGRIYKNETTKARTVRVHADEFNELCGPEFVPMLNKAGGAGYQVTVYTQTWSDVEARIGNKAKAAQLQGNLNNMVMMRVLNTETAEMLTNRLPMVELVSRTTVSGSSDGGQEGIHFGAKTEDRYTTRQVPMLEPADLVKLPKGQAFALLDGGQLYKLRLPLSDENDDPCWPHSMNHVFADMQRKYSRYLDASDKAGTDVFILEQESSIASKQLGAFGAFVEGKGIGW